MWKRLATCRTAAVGTLFVALAVQTGVAQQPSDSCDPARQRQFVQFARNVHRAEARAFATTQAFAGVKAIGADAPDGLHGFNLHLVADETGYMFVLKDVASGCPALMSDNQGGIYVLQPLQ